MLKFRTISWIGWCFLLFLLPLRLLASADFLNNGPISVDKAFQLSLSLNSDKTVHTTFLVEKGYYLYRDRFHFTLLGTSPLNITPLNWPKAEKRYDETLGHYDAYSSTLILTLPLPKNSLHSTFEIQYQGCSKAHFCYPPQTRTFNLNFTTGEVQETVPTLAESKQEESLSDNPHFITVLLSYFGLGLLLAFTPCVLPLLPILSGIILGQATTLKTVRAFYLSLAYVIGMSVIYTLAGLLFSLLGLSLQAAFQTPWMIGFLSVVFLALAICLYLGYDLRLPPKWTHKISSLSEHQTRGHFLSIAVMGALSALIVSPCVSAPLVGALTYISQSQNLWLGGAALFFLSLGMGLPLIVFNTFGAHYIPKTGAWMLGLKKIFAFIFLGLAIYLVSRLLPPTLPLLLWGTFLLFATFSLNTYSKNKKRFLRLRKTFAALCGIYGLLMIVGASLGYTNPWLPLKNPVMYKNSLSFLTVITAETLNTAIQNSKNKPTLIDFYADWCMSCHELERTFERPEIAVLLKQFNLVRVNITASNKDTKALQQTWHVIAPPMLFAVNRDAKQLVSPIVGAVNEQELREQLEKALLNY